MANSWKAGVQCCDCSWRYSIVYMKFAKRVDLGCTRQKKRGGGGEEERGKRKKNGKDVTSWIRCSEGIWISCSLVIRSQISNVHYVWSSVIWQLKLREDRRMKYFAYVWNWGHTREHFFPPRIPWQSCSRDGSHLHRPSSI